MGVYQEWLGKYKDNSDWTELLAKWVSEGQQLAMELTLRKVLAMDLKDPWHTVEHMKTVSLCIHVQQTTILKGLAPEIKGLK